MKKSYIVPAERVKEVCFFSELCQISQKDPSWDVDGGDPGYGGDMEEGEGGAVKRQSTWDNEW